MLEVILVFGLVVVVNYWWATLRLNNWAERSGYVLQRYRLQLWNIGPFSYLGKSGGQWVFRLTAIDANGTRRDGYARVGGFFFGLLRRRVEVRWDNTRLGAEFPS